MKAIARFRVKHNKLIVGLTLNPGIKDDVIYEVRNINGELSIHEIGEKKLSPTYHAATADRFINEAIIDSLSPEEDKS